MNNVYYKKLINKLWISKDQKNNIFFYPIDENERELFYKVNEIDQESVSIDFPISFGDQSIKDKSIIIGKVNEIVNMGERGYWYIKFITDSSIKVSLPGITDVFYRIEAE